MYMCSCWWGNCIFVWCQSVQSQHEYLISKDACALTHEIFQLRILSRSLHRQPATSSVQDLFIVESSFSFWCLQEEVATVNKILHIHDIQVKVLRTRYICKWIATTAFANILFMVVSLNHEVIGANDVTDKYNAENRHNERFPPPPETRWLNSDFVPTPNF